jgi:hypothetical protein
MPLRIDDHVSMEEWELIRNFISRTHGKRHVMQERMLFEWFYCRNGAEDANLVVGRDGSDLVSILGFVPTTFHLNGQQVSGVWTALWFTIPEYRHGVGALLMRRLSERFSIVAGQGASSMNRAVVTAMGHHFLDTIPKVVGVLDTQAMESWINTPRWKSSLRVLSPHLGVSARGLEAESFLPKWENYPHMAFSTLRDFTYLHTRYVSNPFFEYQVRVIGDPETPSVAVYRRISTTTGLVVGRVLEFFGPRGAQFQRQNQALLTLVVAECAEIGCTYIDFYCTDLDSVAMFEDSGFVRDDEGDLPSLLDPIDGSRRQQNLEYFVNQGSVDSAGSWRGCLYATRGDGDQDRPNATYAELHGVGA